MTGGSVFLKSEVVAEAQWLRLERVHYRSSTGTVRHWDRCVRMTPEGRRLMQTAGVEFRAGPLLRGAEPTEEVSYAAPTLRVANAACVIPLTYRSTNREGGKVLVQRPEAGVILVRQFRAPIGAYSIEFPAGLTDEGEAVEDAAVREMKEETGFTVQKVLSCSKALPLSPGVTDETTSVVVATVDLDAEENRTPCQNLDEAEEIDVLMVPLGDLHKRLREEMEKGTHVFDEVYAFSLALNFLPTIEI